MNNKTKNFNVGDIVVALKTISFMDGTKNIKNKEYVVTQETEAYYNVCSKDYVLKKSVG